jgi:hypothetical protein
LSNPNIANPVASPTGTTFYFVNVTDANGCSFSDDLLVIVDNSPSCNPNLCSQPTGATVNPASTSAILSWTLDPGALATQIQYRIPPQQGGGSQGTVIAPTGATSRQLNNLFPNQQYQLRFRHSCSPGVFSEWRFKPFITLPLRVGRQAGMMLYPNPAASHIALDYSSDETKRLLVRIIDPMGREMFVSYQNVTPGKNRIFFDLSKNAFADGIYFLETNDGKARQVKKFVITK